MNIKQPQYIRSALALAVCIGLSGPVLAQSAASLSAAAPSVAPKAAQPQVDDKAAQEAEKSVPSSLRTPSRRSPRPRRL